MAIKRVFNQTASALLGRWFTGEGKPPAWRQGTLRRGAVLPTGYSRLDTALEISGLPQGHVSEIVGPNPTGVMAVGAAIAGKFQRKQLAVTVVDMAKTFDPELARWCGLIAPELLVETPKTVYDMLGVLTNAGRQNGLVVINWGFTPYTLRNIPRASRTTLLKRLLHLSARSHRATLCLTQTEDVDPFIHTNYPRGFPLADAVSVRLWMQNENWVRSRGLVTGYRGDITVIKNDFAANGKGTSLRITFNDPETHQLKNELDF